MAPSTASVYVARMRRFLAGVLRALSWPPDGERRDRCGVAGIGIGVGEHDEALCDRPPLVPALQLRRRADAERPVTRPPFLSPGDTVRHCRWGSIRRLPLPCFVLATDGEPKGRRDYAVLLTLLRLGLRAGEVAHLCLEDIDWRAGEVMVRGKGRPRGPPPTAERRRRGDRRLSARRGAKRAAVHREVFLRAIAPIGPLGRTGSRASCAALCAGGSADHRGAPAPPHARLPDGERRGPAASDRRGPPPPRHLIYVGVRPGRHTRGSGPSHSRGREARDE